MQVEKAIILWAGCGRRISNDHGGIHKAMIPLNGKSLMEYLLDNLKRAGIREVVAVLGYRADEMLKEAEKIWGSNGLSTVINDEFDHTNNLCSLMKTRDMMDGSDFIVLNGDMVFDCGIVKEICTLEGNIIAVDNNDHGYQLDSPRVIVRGGRIRDIGRHLTIDKADGYAIGIYKFSGGITAEYFEQGRELAYKRPEAGYHEPLPILMEEYAFTPMYTGTREWMDIDEKGDVKRAEEMLMRLP